MSDENAPLASEKLVSDTKAWALTLVTVQTIAFGLLTIVLLWKQNTWALVSGMGCAGNAFVWHRLWRWWL